MAEYRSPLLDDPVRKAVLAALREAQRGFTLSDMNAVEKFLDTLNTLGYSVEERIGGVVLDV